MKRQLIIFLFLLSLAAGLLAQPLSIDSTFQPFFDIRSGIGKGDISDLWEDPNSGKLYLSGDFKFYVGQEHYQGHVSLLRDGNYNYEFKGSSVITNSLSKITPFNDSILMFLGNSNIVVPLNKKGELVMEEWGKNYTRKSVRCSAASEPYFFPDGSALMSNAYSSNIPDACKIILPPDTFPHRYIVKIDPQGFWDSTFTPDANHHPRGFMPYDSNRIFIYGDPWSFTHYDSVRVNGLCRIYLDGTIDTTFKTPLLSDTFGLNISSSFRIRNIDKDGSFFIIGTYFLEDYPNKRYNILKFHANGTIDSTFNISQNIENPIRRPVVASIVPTPDGGYLITGRFDRYQGYAKNILAKLDSMGNIEPQYFTTEGPDSSIFWGEGLVSAQFYKSKFGGYYVYGDFAKWDGKPSQPIVRIKEFTTSLEEKNRKEPEIEVFPNPSQSVFNVQSTLPIKQLILFNLSGSQLNTINCTSNCSINLSNYSSGVYLLRLILDNGAMHHRKLIKH